jgi:hypothetical protein
MIDPRKCLDDKNRENLSTLLKDVADEKRKKLREKAVGKVLENVRGMFFAATSVRREK